MKLAHIVIAFNVAYIMYALRYPYTDADPRRERPELGELLEGLVGLRSEVAAYQEMYSETLEKYGVRMSAEASIEDEHEEDVARLVYCTDLASARFTQVDNSLLVAIEELGRVYFDESISKYRRALLSIESINRSLQLCTRRPYQ